MLYLRTYWFGLDRSWDMLIFMSSNNNSTPHKTTMKKPIFGLICISIFLLFTSCAATYKKVNPPQVRYPAISKDSLFSYQYDVLRRAGNRKIAKKEMKAFMHVVAPLQ